MGGWPSMNSLSENWRQKKKGLSRQRNLVFFVSKRSSLRLAANLKPSQMRRYLIDLLKNKPRGKPKSARFIPKTAPFFPRTAKIQCPAGLKDQKPFSSYA